MTIDELRKEIDRIDSEIVRLYGERMTAAERIGEYKKERGMPVTDPARERELLRRVGELAGPENADDVRELFAFLMAKSRARQERGR